MATIIVSMQSESAARGNNPFLKADGFIDTSAMAKLNTSIQKWWNKNHTDGNFVASSNFYTGPVRIAPFSSRYSPDKLDLGYLARRAILIQSGPVGRDRSKRIVLQLFRGMPADLSAEASKAKAAIKQHNANAEKIKEDAKKLKKDNAASGAKVFQEKADLVKQALKDAGIKARFTESSNVEGSSLQIKFADGPVFVFRRIS